jgi:acetyl-CoA acetyltransferase
VASDDIWILGINMTKFGKHADKDIIDLASEAALAALADGGVTMRDIGVLAAGNLMHASGGVGQQLQKQIGQTGIPVFNVANACATGATALRTAIMAIRAGECDTGLAVGVEKLSGAGLLAGGSRKEDAANWTPSGRYGAIAAIDGRVGTETMPGVFAQIGMEYGHRYGGTSFELFARISEKNHAHSTLNPLAAYSKRFTLEEIMGDLMIAYPNTRPMCSANCDGAAAAVVVSGAKLKTLSLEQQRRAVKVSASVLTSDPWEEGCQVLPNVNTLTRNAASQAYELAGVGPEDLDLVELHDCFATAELVHYDNLGLCPGVTAPRPSTCRAASSRRATRSPPPASPTSGRWRPTCAARPATARSRERPSASPTSSGWAQPAGCISWSALPPSGQVLSCPVVTTPHRRRPRPR